MSSYHLNQTLDKLKGPSSQQIIVNNQWAAAAFDMFHNKSKAKIIFEIDGEINEAEINWDSDFSKAAMKENIDKANHGGVAMAWFVMSVLLNYEYTEQSEINDGVDYRFYKIEPNEDDLNFLDEFHYVEVSGILKETKTNKIIYRLTKKHEQIKKGLKFDQPSSIIITHFYEPKTIKAIHL
jgi:hypothetical protein